LPCQPIMANFAAACLFIFTLTGMEGKEDEEPIEVEIEMELPEEGEAEGAEYERLRGLEDKRTLTFCHDIAQTEVLGKYCVHSKNGQSNTILRMFNDKEISHITACQMLNEGVNLTECQYGIFANLNSSKIIQAQRVGRLLRHKHPKIIIPYFTHSREEEIVKKMLEGYDKSLVETRNIEGMT